jgi:hypothetical protein
MLLRARRRIPHSTSIEFVNDAEPDRKTPRLQIAPHRRRGIRRLRDRFAKRQAYRKETSNYSGPYPMDSHRINSRAASHRFLVFHMQNLVFDLHELANAREGSRPGE